MKLFIRPVVAFLLLFMLFGNGKAQDIRYARNVIQELSTPEMHGRGYVFRGDSIAASFIKTEMALNGLRPFESNFYQPFNLSVNTLPGAMTLKVNKRALKPGYDYLVETPSAGVNGSFRTRTISHNTSQRRLERLKRRGLGGRVLVVDDRGEEKTHEKLFNNLKYYNEFDAKAVVKLTANEPPLMWRVYTGHLLLDFPSLVVSSKNVGRRIRRVCLDIENTYYQSYPTQNVLGYIEGSHYPDSFFVFIAHYDHLGRMGKDTYFPGAHDNASGVALMLDLAGYYSENPPDYSIAFIAFAAEEAGLLGSHYYTENPVFPLENIKFLINLDMISTGEEGLMVVNGNVFTEAFGRLKDINKTHGFMKQIRSRGAAANSDHYYFYKNGVESFYFYTLGGESHYHNIFDKAETLSLYGYNNLFRLITLFIEDMSKN